MKRSWFLVMLIFGLALACAAAKDDGRACWRAAYQGEAPADVVAADPVQADARRRTGLVQLISTAAVAQRKGSETDGTVTLKDGTVVRLKCAQYVSGDSISGTAKVGNAKADYECEGGVFAVRFNKKGEIVAMAGARLCNMSGPGLRISRLQPGSDLALVKDGGKWRGVLYQPDPQAPVPPQLMAITDNWEVRPVGGSASGKNYRERKRQEIENRIRLIAAPAPGEIRVRPTFCSCGWHWTCGTKVEGLVAECRKAEAADWKVGLPPEYFAETKSCRASFIYLEEDTDYELRLVANGQTLKKAKFRTWASEVPVAQTVIITPATFKAPFVISKKGKKNGWIRYVVKGGRLELREAKPAFVLDGAEYVLLDDMTVVSRPEARYVVDLRNTKDVRIRNCDFSGWGRIGTPDYIGRAHGKKVDRTGSIIEYDAAVHIGRGCVNTVVERCWIHDPVIGANSWRYSHPAGGEAIVAFCGPGTVIRYNDFVGSDKHRWQDTVEGKGNFYEDGGLNRDADVYGNFMIYSADDNIELDGGQQNVRCFRNRFENALVGVSIQGCMVGPSYVFDNAFIGGAEEFSLGGLPIKTVGINPYGDYTCAYIFGNDFWRPYTPVYTGEKLVRFVLRDNRSEGDPIFRNVTDSPYSEETNNVDNVAFERDGAIAMPFRPVPFELDRGLVEGVKLADGGAVPATVQVTATVGGTGYKKPFAVAQNADFDWFSVSPARGVLKSGEKVVFTVTFDAAKMRDRHEYRGAFLVRTEDGYSRPVTVYAEGQYENPARPEKPGMFAQYRKWKGGGEYAFDVPKDGKYFLLARVCGRMDRINYTASLDGDAPVRGNLAVRPYWAWQFVDINPLGDMGCTVFDLKAGTHVLKFEDTNGHVGKRCKLEAFVLTDDPGPFEPR